MSLHVFGAVITAPGVAANNRGETEGNITTLQKLLWQGQVHTTVSAEAIRWAIRYYWQIKGLEVNRVWNDEKEDHCWQDAKWLPWTNPDGEGKDKIPFIDDDVLGFMLTEAAAAEGSDTVDELKKQKKQIDEQYKSLPKEDQKSDEGKELKKRLKEIGESIKTLSKGSCDKRRGVLEIARAISATPFAGDITFNAKSGEKGRTSLYGTEVHATRYQYGFALTPARLRVKSRALDAIDAIANLGEVAGNHSRFLFDFSPESIVLRLTHDPAPRLLYCFKDDKNGTIKTPELVRRIQVGDIQASELYIGGPISENEDIKNLGKINSYPGVIKAVTAFKEALQEEITKIKNEGEIE